MALGLRPVALAAALVAPFALAACGSGGGLGTALLQSAGVGAGAASADDTASIPRAEIEAVGAPIMRVTIPATGLDVLMVQRDTKPGGITTWSTNDGITFTFRDGILIETRGLGADLMSAAAPSAGQILAATGHSRSYFFIGPDDQTLRRDYACQPQDQGPETVSIYSRGYATRQVTETCTRAEGRIENRFWLQGGKVRKSRQWVSAAIGYAGFEQVTD